MHLVLDSEPIRAILAVSHIQFLRSQKLNIRKSNSLEVACERRRVEVSPPEVLVLERPIYNHSVSTFSELLQQRRGGRKAEDDETFLNPSDSFFKLQQRRRGRKVKDD